MHSHTHAGAGVRFAYVVVVVPTPPGHPTSEIFTDGKVREGVRCVNGLSAKRSRLLREKYTRIVNL
jgi:hypothetical protein